MLAFPSTFSLALFFLVCEFADETKTHDIHDIPLLLTVQPNDAMNAQNCHHVCNNGNEMIFASNYTADTLLGNYSNGYHPHRFRL